jgi:pimeloyl-ACP methyl ester carboxylesterase
MPVQSYVLPTSHAAIAVSESAGSGPPVLLIHGNSGCKEVFRNQMEGEIGARWRLIAFDLPGHGRSSNARDPSRTYQIPGYADLVAELAWLLGLERFAAFGWSLGGHVGLEALTRCSGLAGLMITGTPPVPVTPEGLGQGFLPSEHMAITGKQDLTEAEAEDYARAICVPFDPLVLNAVKRTDGRARTMMLGAALSGWGTDERHLVETLDRPLGVVAGGEDPFVNNAYLQGIAYKHLWDGAVHVLPGIGHAPFWQAPEQFNPLLARFLADVL